MAEFITARYKRTMLMKRGAIGVPLLSLAVGFCILPGVVRAAPAEAAACQGLVSLATPKLQITATQLIPAGPLTTVPAMARLGDLPEHCLVRGIIAPRTGTDGRQYGVGFEVRLPSNWNGRFLFQGGGGLDGSVQPAIGMVATDGKPALLRGFAVISSDGGHEGADASFASDQQARLDFAYAGIGPVTQSGKEIVAHYYGSEAKFSYFIGCSNGGREAMMAAQRYPSAFDGIVAGDPGFNLSAAAVQEMWSLKALLKIAPKDDQDRPVLSAALADSDLRLLAKSILDACDQLDGVRDGMINNTAACHFKPQRLLCKAGQRQDCLSSAKVAALDSIFGGARDPRGRALYASFPYDAGVDTPGWRMWKLGTSPTFSPNALDATLGLGSMRQYMLTPPNLAIAPQEFDFSRDFDKTLQTAAINDATSTVLSGFSAHGGKLIIYQGMSDPVFSANAIIHWYQQLQADFGAPQSWARLFLVPGMNHCGGGPATDQFDALTAIQDWTEGSQAPDLIPAHAAAASPWPGRTRPLCAYPHSARYKGSGNIERAESFECRS